MKDIIVEKGFCKKVFDLNQFLKHVFSEYLILEDGNVIEASNQPLNSLNVYRMDDLFITAGLPSNIIIDSTLIYKALIKGRQLVKYIRIGDDNKLYFVKIEDETYQLYEFGRYVTDLRPFEHRLKRLENDFQLTNGLMEYQFPDNLFDKLIGGKFIYLPCGEHEIILGKRLFDGIKDTHGLSYSYTNPVKVDVEKSKFAEYIFVVKIVYTVGDYEAIYFFEASVF